MKKTIFRIIFFVMIFRVGDLFGQLTIENLETLPDIAGTQVNDIIQDRFGYIWMATQNGLIKYDGYDFQRFYYDPNDSTSIQTILTLSLYEDKKGDIWIGCLEFAYKFDQTKKSFTKYKFGHLVDRPKYEPYGIFEIVEDINGRIIFGISSQYEEYTENGLLYFDEKEEQIKVFTSPKNFNIQNINNIETCPNDNLWISAYNGFFNISDKGVITKIDLPSDFISLNPYYLNYKIALDNAGKVLITSGGSRFFSYDPETKIFNKYSLSTNEGSSGQPLILYYLTVGPENLLWLGTSHGLISFDRITGKSQRFNESDLKATKIKFESITKVLLDSFGVLWMGSSEFGVLKYENKSVFESLIYNPEDELNSLFPGWVNSIRQGRNDKVWVLGGHAINLWNPVDKSLAKYDIQKLLPYTWGIFDLYEEEEGYLLISTNLGTFNFYPNKGKTEKSEFEGVVDSVLVNRFFKDSKDNFWLGTTSGLLKRAKGKHFFEHYDMTTYPEASIVTNEVRNFFESPKHGLWVQTNDGLFLYDYSKNEITRHVYDKKSGDVLVSQDINSFFEDTEGIAWIGTWQGGLSRYVVGERKIKTYTISDGLPSMSIQAILPDEKNKTLWLSTFNGLSRFELETEQFSNFTVADGVHGHMFGDGVYLKTSTGLLAFGGEGVTLVDPDQFATNSTPPKVLITDFKIDNKTISKIVVPTFTGSILETEKLVLNYNQNNISIDFVAIHFSKPSRNKYSYKLENFDTEWREVGNQRTAFYTNLSPGIYVFRVKASNPYGKWNEEGDTITIEILPPWWKTYWAYSIYFFLFIGLVFLVDRFQRKKLIKKELERTREKELAHGREIEKAYSELKSTQAQLIQSEKMASLGELTAGIAHEIQNPLNFVNNFSEVSAELMEELKGERLKVDGERNESVEEEIISDVIQNLEKINHHGKRADAIVKGMLEHSRSGSGVKELTDLNTLTNEYLNLSYQSFKSKNKEVEIDLIKIFDPSLSKVEVVRSDIGKVLFNILNNAFYACTEQSAFAEKGKLSQSSELWESYKPLVTVSTSLLEGGRGIEISIKDNGPGIPEAIKSKIFQPFFTTKPTGQGTGLGLSLSYDIIKAHGGELKVESQVGLGTTFIIILKQNPLPINI
jgi:signal transduction histidine kinase/ligand-binding sensor domain-containing protein